MYFVNQSTSQVKTLALNYVKNCQSILVKVHSRVHDFLSQTEKQLIFGQIHSDIFEKNRSYVDLKLGALCPDALLKFVSAHKRIKEDDPESWAQSLTTCRRLLKSLADSLCPAPVDPVVGIDGKKRNCKNHSGNDRKTDKLPELITNGDFFKPNSLCFRDFIHDYSPSIIPKFWLVYNE